MVVLAAYYACQPHQKIAKPARKTSTAARGDVRPAGKGRYGRVADPESAEEEEEDDLEADSGSSVENEEMESVVEDDTQSEEEEPQSEDEDVAEVELEDEEPRPQPRATKQDKRGGSAGAAQSSDVVAPLPVPKTKPLNASAGSALPPRLPPPFFKPKRGGYASTAIGLVTPYRPPAKQAPVPAPAAIPEVPIEVPQIMDADADNARHILAELARGQILD